MMKNEIERLKEKFKELKGKVKKLKEKLRERIENEELYENMIEMCEEECLHNNVKEFKLVFPPLSDNFKLCLLDLKKVKYKTRLSSTEFSDFINEVTPSISYLNWRGELQTNTKITPINFLINHSIFLFILVCTLPNSFITLLLLFSSSSNNFCNFTKICEWDC
jgi:sugar-specific transcriptional regulator TrmB